MHPAWEADALPVELNPHHLHGGPDRSRTDNLPAADRTLSQLSYRPIGDGGPRTRDLDNAIVARSHLRYVPVERMKGVEPSAS